MIYLLHLFLSKIHYQKEIMKKNLLFFSLDIVMSASDNLNHARDKISPIKDRSLMMPWKP